MPSNHPARARALPPRHLLALAALALSAAVVLWCARDAYAQQLIPGVGYPDPPRAYWEDGGSGSQRMDFALDASARPWGPDGGPPCADAGLSVDDLPAYWRRYAGGNELGNWRPIGPSGEFHGKNLWALQRWFEEAPPEHRQRYTGEPTAEECWDVAFSVARTSGFFRTPTPDPTPTPSPTPRPTATPAPTPVATPTPSCPTITCVTCPTCPPTPEPPCVPLSALLPPPAQRETLEEMGTWDKRLSAVRRRKLRELAAWWRGLGEWKAPSTGRLDYCVVSQ